MNYISTRGGIPPVYFNDAVMMGLATDGGLLLPAAIPSLKDRLRELSASPYADLAYHIIAPFVADDIPETRLRDIIDRSYAAFDHPDVSPTVAVGDLHILELFHGPTLAFKDIALQFLGNVFDHILTERGDCLNILGATSGDTGSAAIHGVRGKPGIEIFIMHPDGRVSPIQEKQMTTVLDDNVHNIAIQGTFDDGQRIMKEIFSVPEFKRTYKLGAVNSVNWARVLAQVVYYFHACFAVQKRTGADTVQFSVPTGNFGDIFAGYIAWRMGAPISKLILATNENDILSRFFTTGVYRKSDVHPTLSPSMDIQVASNFERYLYYRVGENPTRVREMMADFSATGVLEVGGGDSLFTAGRGDTAATLAVINRYWRDFGYLLDPHTAVGVSVAERFISDQAPTVCLATAHPAKFPAAIAQAVGADIARHPRLEGITELPSRRVTLPATVEAVTRHIEATLSS
ncbi:MAG: threonine synthase [Lentisphaeria bacterium]|nr:threonine synthase [Lentisphaeria bacterium]